jgi:hypothetical protein
MSAAAECEPGAALSKHQSRCLWANTILESAPASRIKLRFRNHLVQADFTSHRVRRPRRWLVGSLAARTWVPTAQRRCSSGSLPNLIATSASREADGGRYL